jgi:pimeloyl-ACP methyl ester carboxylesterase
VVGVVFVAASPGAAEPARPEFVEMPCPEDVFPPERGVRCGTITVPENRADPNGRTITVAAAVAPASGDASLADPIVFLDGGPSFGAIDPFALDAYFVDWDVVEHRDVILVDTRGTGLSEPRLGCPEFDEGTVAGAYSEPYVDSRRFEEQRAGVVACRDRLSDAGIDLSAYNSAESAADLEDLRRALGYDQWNLLAISADGVLGLTYMRLFPGAIRSAIIDSGQSTTWLGGYDYARGNTEVLERVFAGCAANAACDARYPDIRSVFYDVVHELEAEPLIFSVPEFEPEPVTFRIDGVWFYFDAMHGIFPGNREAPDTIHHLLSEIWRAGHGEAEAVMRERAGLGPITSDAAGFVAEGKTMSYLCHDIIGFITPEDAQQAARDIPEMAPAFLAPGYDSPFDPESCEIWGVGVADPVQHEPVVSEINTLVLAGEFDAGGGVPPLITRQIPETLANSWYFEFPAGAHLQLASYNVASDCAREIASQFLDAPDAEPDASCIGSVAPFDFTPPDDDP